MSIRSEAQEFREALTKAILRATDDVPNKTEIPGLMNDGISAFMEAKDFSDMPQGDRLDAAMLSLSGTMADLAEAKIAFSDE